MDEDKQVEIREDHISQLMCGERPEGMDFNEFKLKRKAIQLFLKQRERVFYNERQPYRKQSNIQGENN